jgi:glycosyltransferase involved in cell wall biosynthesis
MKTGIVLDNKVHKRVLQHFEPLRDRIDMTVFVGERNDYDTGIIDLNKHQLRHSEETSLALKAPVEAYRRILGAPFKKMDFYYFSLKKYLGGMDIAYSCDITRSAYTLASLKERLGFRFVLSWWENIPYRAALDEKAAFCKKFIMDRVDMFLPFTHKAKETLMIEGVDERRIRVIYPAVDLDRFSPGEKPSYLMDKMNIPDRAFVVLYVGKLVSWKGVHNLIYMARILKQKGVNNFVVAVTGKGAQKENMLKIIKESGTEENFRFLDFVEYDEIPDIHRMADVLVLPSYPTITWQEQLGAVLVEAIASGKPVISTHSGSIP